MYLSELTNLKVLLVEDNRINQLLISKQLSNWGVVVDIASDGLVAVEKAVVGSYDLILMDLLLPKLDGFGATYAIRQMNVPALNTIPIIALSASSESEHYSRAHQVGVTDYLTKPIEESELYHCLCHYTFMQTALGA